MFATGSNDSIVLLLELKTYISPANAAAVAPGSGPKGSAASLVHEPSAGLYAYTNAAAG